MYKPVSHESWSTDDPHNRWIDAGNMFGYHLMQAARDYAFERIPPSASAECRDVARQAALDAIYGVMMLLDGVADSGDVQYSLFVEIADDPIHKTMHERIELAPNGDGLCMGFVGWVEGDFGIFSD